MNMFMLKNRLLRPKFNTMSLNIVDFQILLSLAFINTKIKVFLS